ncbi:MAG: histidine kinase [Clostridiales Family XIII bacterium]|jgi:signal transduction histidine kinase|nr:histidine kinase [Clostridiales Family XIII bacterium]
MTKERGIFLCIATLAAAALGFAGGGEIATGFAGQTYGWPRDLVIVLILATVACACAALFARVIGAPKPWACVLSALSCAAATICSPSTALPVIAASAVSLSCEYVRILYTVVACAASCVLGALALGTGVESVIGASVVCAASAYILSLMEKRDEARRESYERSDRIEYLEGRVSSQGRLAKSMDHIAKLEERNRLAARIHDEVGHGMSGSILLLEGADMIMDKDPSEARATMRRATENLRKSTEKIRAVLQGERSDTSEVNLAKVRAALASFEADHTNIRTRLKVEGSAEGIGGDIWACVMDNMVEATTNTLKHSDATTFNVKIANSNKLLTVEFSDNGTGIGQDGSPVQSGSAPFLPGEHGGMGLRNMEERCALAYGRCFFHSRPDGFRVVMAFPQKPRSYGYDTSNN